MGPRRRLDIKNSDIIDKIITEVDQTARDQSRSMV